jgi:Protein of unknown function (DUF2914)
MSEQKNIVIKVKYPSPGASPTHTGPRPGVITEWNYKRIGLVLGAIVLALMSVLYFSDSDDKQPANTQSAQLALPEPTRDIKPNTEKVVNAPAQPKINTAKTVARSQLTSEIERNEPVDTLKLPLKIGKKETLGVYYFVELRGMKGKTVYHEWLLNGDLVSRKKVNISADPWRTASKQVISYTINNDWAVRLVDEAGNKLNEKAFNLDLK